MGKHAEVVLLTWQTAYETVRMSVSGSIFKSGSDRQGNRKNQNQEWQTSNCLLYGKVRTGSHGIIPAKGHEI